MAKRNEGEVEPDTLLWKHSTNKDGLHPVKLRVTFHRKSVYYSVMDQAKKKLFLSEPDFTKITTTLNPRGENKRIKEIIDSAKENAKAAIKAATNSGKDPFSFAEFERKYLGQESDGQFLKFFEKHLKSIEGKQAGTARVYRSVLNSFTKFLKKDIDPGDITPELLEEYENSLREDGNSDTWISICMRCLRAIYNRLSANDDYLKMKYPFSRTDYDGKYKIPISSGQKGITMTKDEMETFINGKVPGEATPENPYYRAKMLFLFSFYGQGLNFKDIALLKQANIKGRVIEFERQKTIRTRRKAVVIRIPITEELEKIILEIGNPSKGKANYLFPFVFDPLVKYTEKQIDAKVLQFVKTTNKWLKRYCEHELNKFPVVSTYAARHTFASLAKSHLPLAQLSAMLGHSKIETTQIYLGRFEDSENHEGLMKVFKSIKKKSA